MSEQGRIYSKTLLPPFRCGHPRSDENMYFTGERYVCQTCKRRNARESRRRHYRKNYLHQAIENAERKLASLYVEAKRNRRSDILKKASVVDAAWDRMVMIERIEAAKRDKPQSLSDIP